MKIYIHKVSIKHKLTGFQRNIGWELKVKFNADTKIVVDMYPTKTKALQVAKAIKKLNTEIKNCHHLRDKLNNHPVS